MSLRPATSCMLLLLSSCELEPPSSCLRMCEQATELYASCLADWGVDWDAAGYHAQDDFQDRCEVWVWEMQLLETDAVQRGALEDHGALVEACEERTALLRGPEARCEDYSSIPWDEAPWESSP